MPVPHCFNYYIVVKFETQKYKSSNFIVLSNDIFVILDPLNFHKNFKISLLMPAKKKKVAGVFSSCYVASVCKFSFISLGLS